MHSLAIRSVGVDCKCQLFLQSVILVRCRLFVYLSRPLEPLTKIKGR